MGKEFNHRGHRGKIYFLKNSVYSLISITQRELPFKGIYSRKTEKVRVSIKIER